MTSERPTMTPGEVADYIGVSEPTVRRLVRSGRLPRIEHIGIVLIPRTAVVLWAEGVYHDAPDGRARTGHRRADQERDPLPDRGDDGGRAIDTV